jgi:peroxiredoxin
MGAVALALLLVYLAPGVTPPTVQDESAQSGDDAATDAAYTGKTAPLHFTLKDMNGVEVKLNSFKGKVILLNFWATWCPPCVDEVPSLEDLARRLKGSDMRMLAVSVDDDWDKIRRYFAKGSDIGVVLDTSHDVPKKFGTEKFPETFLIDAAGRVRYYFINKRDWSRPEAVACLESLR